MSDLAIRLTGLGKAYNIGERNNADPRIRYGSLRDSLAGLFRRKKPAAATELFWALKDVSLEINHGEIIGVIGRNGAGKSTLLKIISRITEPTEGFGEVHGRIGSLLEVGTGFHPELTGRENILLNGTILGMKRAEVLRKFDEIVAFAEIEQFLETPVKRYSSGMFVRLAFAVAVHLEPEILVVDEVLAVGDAEFQRKCLDKLRAIGGGGRTILLVSHNMSAIRSICKRGIVLDHGQIVAEGDINTVADEYLASTGGADHSDHVLQTEKLIVNDISIRSLDGPVIKTFDTVEIMLEITAKVDISDPAAYVGILGADHHRLAGLDSKDFRTFPPLPGGERATIGFRIDQFPFLTGAYFLDIRVGDCAEFVYESIDQQFRFDVVATPVYGGRQMESLHGQVGLKARAITGSE
jgi:lipopolysaccharide transport system ATP-binding protein